MIRSCLFAVLAIVVMVIPAHAGNCRHFFAQQQVVYAPAYYPQVHYFAGQNIQDAALVEKIARRVVELQGQVTQKQAAPQKVTLLQQKCVRCHNPNKASGDLVLDGSVAVPDSSYRRFHKMAGLGEDVPPEMEKVIAALTPQEKGILTEELLRLEPPPAAKADEAPPAAPPNPRPSDGDLE